MGTLAIDLFLCSITPSHLIPVLKATDYCAQLPSLFCHYPLGIALREREPERTSSFHQTLVTALACGFLTHFVSHLLSCFYFSCPDPDS